MMHAIRNDVGPLLRSHMRAKQRTEDNEEGKTFCGKTLEEVKGQACYPSAFVDCPACLEELEKE